MDSGNTDQDKRVTFENVAGLKEEKEQLEEMIIKGEAPWMVWNK